MRHAVQEPDRTPPSRAGSRKKATVKSEMVESSAYSDSKENIQEGRARRPLLSRNDLFGTVHVEAFCRVNRVRLFHSVLFQRVETRRVMIDHQHTCYNVLGAILCLE
jgi:hypothetical protein